MLEPLETLPLKEFFKFIGRVVLYALLVYPLKKIFGLAAGSEGESLLITLVTLAAVYPTLRLAGFSFGRLGEYWAGLRGEGFRALKYVLIAELAVFVCNCSYDLLLAPWDLAWTNKLLFWNSQSHNPVALDARLAEVLGSPALLASYVLGACVVAPPLEEFMLRRWFYAASRKYLPVAAALAANAALFGALHGSDFFATGLYGLCYCWAYERTGKLETPVLMHAYSNLLAVTLLLGEKLLGR